LEPRPFNALPSIWRSKVHLQEQYVPNAAHEFELGTKFSSSGAPIKTAKPTHATKQVQVASGIPFVASLLLTAGHSGELFLSLTLLVAWHPSDAQRQTVIGSSRRVTWPMTSTGRVFDFVVHKPTRF
jgi:hypothetical protein